jgi:hypothetical protein
MKLHNWLARLRQRLFAGIFRPWGRQIRRRAAGTSMAPQLECLESRDLPSGLGAATDSLRQAYGQLPLSFEANQGQTDPQVNFVSRGNGYGLFLSPAEAVLTLSKPLPKDGAALTVPRLSAADVLRMRLIGGNEAAQPAGLEQQETRSNYLIGNDPSKWRTNVANFG